MGRRCLPVNGTQTKNVTNKMCIKTTINTRLTIYSTINMIEEINCLTALC